MQLTSVVLAAAALFSSSVVAEGFAPGDDWKTLTPSATFSCGFTSYPTSFGIAAVPIASQLVKRDAATKTVQATTHTTVQKIHTTVVNMTTIMDTVRKVETVTCSNGKLLNDSPKVKTSASVRPTTVLQPIPTKPETTSAGKETTAAGKETTSEKTKPTPKKTQSDSTCPAELELPNKSCSSPNTLSMTLTDGILIDSKGRIGSIVANRQFQFDGPPPQAGAIFAAGWSITPEGNLAIGDNDVFYQCLSGTFFNLYDQSIGEQCSPVHLEAIQLIECK